MKRTASQKRRIAAQRKAHRYFGIVKIKAGTKVCFLAKEDKNGWALGLGLNTRNVWLTGLRFKSREEVSRVLERSSVVFIHLKNSKENK